MWVTGIMQAVKVLHLPNHRKGTCTMQFKLGREMIYHVHRKISAALGRHKDRFLPEVPLSYEELLNLYYATDGSSYIAPHPLRENYISPEPRRAGQKEIHACVETHRCVVVAASTACVCRMSSSRRV